MLDQLAIGFAQLAAPVHLGMLALGLLVGLLVAILPGLTLVMGIALALPFTGLISNRTFYFAGPEFIAAEGDVIRIIFEQLWIMEAWAGAHPDEVAALLAP